MPTNDIGLSDGAGISFGCLPEGSACCHETGPPAPAATPSLILNLSRGERIIANGMDVGQVMGDTRAGLLEGTFGNVLKHDGPAAIVVFLVALPLCLGIALGSGAPLIAGMTAGIVGGIVVGVLSGSQVSVSGPAAGLVVIVLTAIQRIGSFRGFLV